MSVANAVTAMAEIHPVNMRTRIDLIRAIRFSVKKLLLTGFNPQCK